MSSIAEEIAPTGFFRFEFPLLYSKLDTNGPRDPLSDKYLLPHFAAMSGSTPLAKLRGGWSEKGLLFDIEKTRRDTRKGKDEDEEADLDSIVIWIDTRHEGFNQRPTLYCFELDILSKTLLSKKPTIELHCLANDRGVLDSQPSLPLYHRLGSATSIHSVQIGIPATSLRGFSPTESPNIGLFYFVSDQNDGFQTMSLDRTYRFHYDPSLWCFASLIR